MDAEPDVPAPAWRSRGADVSAHRLAAERHVQVSNHLRAWFEIETRPRLSADADTFPPPGPLPNDNGMSWSIPTHLLFVGAKGSDGKREYRATGTLMRFSELPVQPITAGVWECRYVLRLAKVDRSDDKSPRKQPKQGAHTMARWQVRKVAGKKTLQIWDDKFKAIVAESPSGSVSQVSAVIATLRIVVGDAAPARPSTSTTNRNHAPTGGHHGALDTRGLLGTLPSATPRRRLAAVSHPAGGRRLACAGSRPLPRRRWSLRAH